MRSHHSDQKSDAGLETDVMAVTAVLDHHFYFHIIASQFCTNHAAFIYKHDDIYYHHGSTYIPKYSEISQETMLVSCDIGDHWTDFQS